MRIKILVLGCLFLLFSGGAIAKPSNDKTMHISYNYSVMAPLGLSFGYMPDKVGGYLSCKFALASTSGATESYSVDENAATSNYEKKGKNRGSYTAGIMFSLVDWLAMYAGAGYGSYSEVWGEENDNEAKIVTDKFSGPEFELGLMYMGKSWLCGAGCIFMKGTNVSSNAMLLDLSLQVGMRF